MEKYDAPTRAELQAHSRMEKYDVHRALIFCNVLKVGNEEMAWVMCNLEEQEEEQRAEYLSGLVTRLCVKMGYTEENMAEAHKFLRESEIARCEEFLEKYKQHQARAETSSDKHGPRVPEKYDAVLQSLDYLACILEQLHHDDGLRTLAQAGRVCRVWREAACGRREAWSVVRVVQSGDRATVHGWATVHSWPAGAEPVAVAVLPGGELCVTLANHSLEIFSPEPGTPTRVIGRPGVIFSFPKGVAFNKCQSGMDGPTGPEMREALFVADSINDRVAIIDFATGHLLDQIPIHHPTDVCFMGDAICVADSRNSCVSICDVETMAIRSIGRGKFDHPIALTSHAGELYVVDRDKCCVQACGANRRCAPVPFIATHDRCSATRTRGTAR